MRFCETCHVEKEIIEFIGGRKHCKKCNKMKYNERVKKGVFNVLGEKECSKCKEVKNSTEFRIHKSYCKKCENKKTYESRKDVQYENNKEYLKEYYKENREQINEWRKEYSKNRIKNDNLYKCSLILSKIVRHSLKSKGVDKCKKSEEIIGLSRKDFKIYIESKFEDWMSWENYGLYNGELNHGWDIDHIIPISSATTEEEIIKLNHYINLQPLCSYTNRYIKKDIILESKSE